MLYRVAFSGLLNVGKDYVASKAGFFVESVARPLYRLADAFFHNADYKKHSDLRLYLQRVGQWGWGFHDPVSCPYSVERAMFNHLMRTEGKMITGMPEYNWERFGLAKTFWIDGCLNNIRNKWTRDARVAITNARFDHEVEPMKKAGFEQYLVCCSPETRAVRCGGKICSVADSDISEQYARKLEDEIADDHVIWNDDVPIPVGKNYLTLEQFCIDSMRPDENVPMFTIVNKEIAHE